MTAIVLLALNLLCYSATQVPKNLCTSWKSVSETPFHCPAQSCQPLFVIINVRNLFVITLACPYTRNLCAQYLCYLLPSNLLSQTIADQCLSRSLVVRIRVCLEQRTGSRPYLLNLNGFLPGDALDTHQHLEVYISQCQTIRFVT